MTAFHHPRANHGAARAQSKGEVECAAEIDQPEGVQQCKSGIGSGDRQWAVASADLSARGDLNDARRCSSMVAARVRKFVGVHRLKGSSGFAAYVDKGGQRYHLGTWPTAKLAAVARDSAALFLGFDDRDLNLPDESRSIGPRAPDEILRASRLRKRRFLGVAFDKRSGAWTARVQSRGINCSVTGLEREEEAAVARDRMALWLGLSRGQLNLPERKLEPASPDDIRRELGPGRNKEQTSGYLGVWHERDSIVACVTVNGKRHVVGGFESERAAATARDRMALWLLGARARLNFPNARLAPVSPAGLKREREIARRRRMSSRYRGVSLVTASPDSKIPWVAFLSRPGGESLWSLGRWASERAAALAHDRAVLHYYGEGELNLPAAARRLGPASAKELREQARREYKELTVSRYRGVSRMDNGTWTAQVVWQKRRYYLGSFHVEEEAARAYDRAASRLMGDKARLNFDDGRRGRRR